MLHRLFRFRLDVEIALEPDAAPVVAAHAEELRHVVLLKRHIRVEQRLIALASAPKNVATRAELHRELNALFRLCRRKAEDVRRVAAARAVHEARVAEHVGGRPEAPDTGAFGLFEEVVGQLVEAAVRLVDVGGILRDDIRVVEAVILDAEFLHELNARIHLCLCMRHRAGLCAERLVRRARAEHIYAHGTEIVPPCHCERKVLLHRLAEDHALRIIVFERQTIFTVSALVFDLRDIREKLAHAPTPFLFVG